MANAIEKYEYEKTVEKNNPDDDDDENSNGCPDAIKDEDHEDDFDTEMFEILGLSKDSREVGYVTACVSYGADFEEKIKVLPKRIT